MSSAEAVMTRITWIMSHAESSAGTNGPGSRYSAGPAISIVTTAASRTNPPTVLTLYRSSTTVFSTETMINATTDEYSYMFPHGRCPAAAPRVITETACAARPDHDRTFATLQVPSRRNPR